MKYNMLFWLNFYTQEIYTKDQFKSANYYLRLLMIEISGRYKISR